MGSEMCIRDRFLVGIMVMSFDFASATAVGEKIKANGALPVAQTIANMSLFVIFFAAVFTVTGAMRDDVHKSLEIIHSTPVRTPPMIWARLTGVLATVFACLSALVVGMFIGQFMPWTDKETIGAINILYFCLLYTSPSPRDRTRSRMPSSA